VVWRIPLIALVLGVVPGALWLGGGLPLPEQRDDLVAATSTPLSSEDEWVARVNVICRWEQKRAKTLRRAFRGVTTRADFALVFQSALNYGEESLAIFARLHPPLTYRREAREIKALVRREQTSLRAALAAFERGDRSAFIHAMARSAEADARSSRMLYQLGATTCAPRPAELPQQPRASIV
jgi:hypothetical protein